MFCCFISWIQNESYGWRISQLQHPSYIWYKITVAITAVGQSQSSIQVDAKKPNDLSGRKDCLQRNFIKENPAPKKMNPTKMAPTKLVLNDIYLDSIWCSRFGGFQNLFKKSCTLKIGGRWTNLFWLCIDITVFQSRMYLCIEAWKVHQEVLRKYPAWLYQEGNIFGHDMTWLDTPEIDHFKRNGFLPTINFWEAMLVVRGLITSSARLYFSSRNHGSRTWGPWRWV